MLDTSLQQNELNYFQQLASVEIDNQIWFIADDVTQMLALNDPVKMNEISPKFIGMVA